MALGPISEQALNKALEEKYLVYIKKDRCAIRVRCFVHKWRNIEKVLGTAAHKAVGLFWALRDAKDHSEAKLISDRLESVCSQTLARSQA